MPTLRVLFLAAVISFIAGAALPSAARAERVKLNDRIKNALHEAGKALTQAAQHVGVFVKRDLASPRALWQAISRRCGAATPECGRHFHAARCSRCR